MTQELAQVNATLSEITFYTKILFTLTNFQVSVSQLRHRVNIIRDALTGLQINLDILYHHFSVLVDSKLTPDMIPPTQLMTILNEVKEDIRGHPRLVLPEEPTDLSVYKYYKMIKFQVTMEQELMLGVMQIPLVDINAEFRLYKIYNLPVPLPEAKIQVQYDLSVKYLAITKGDQYVTFPTEHEIMGCQLTAGALCELNTALFPTLNLNSCEFALYKRAHDQVIKNCRVRTSPLRRDHAISLEPNYWVVVTQAPRVLHIICLQTTTYLQVKYPIDIVHLQDGCEATSSTLVLPGHSRLVKEDNSILNSHSVQFTLQYTKVQDFDLIKQIIPEKLSPQQLKAIGDSIPEPQTSSIMTLQGQLKDINTNYPYVMPLYLKIVITCISTILLVLGVTLCFKCYKRGCSVNKSVIFSKTCKTGTKNQGRPQSIFRKILFHMETTIPAQVIGGHRRNGNANAADDGTCNNKNIERPQGTPTCLGSPKTHQRGVHRRRRHSSDSRDGGMGPRNQCGPGFQEILQQKEGQTKRTSLPPAINKHMKHDITIHYVLCSHHFEDMVLIHPSNIDTCELNSNYETP